MKVEKLETKMDTSQDTKQITIPTAPKFERLTKLNAELNEDLELFLKGLKLLSRFKSYIMVITKNFHLRSRF